MSDESSNNPFENFNEIEGTPAEMDAGMESLIRDLVSEYGEHSVEVMMSKTLRSIIHLRMGRIDLALLNVIEVEQECRDIFGEDSLEFGDINKLTLQCLIAVMKIASTVEDKNIVYQSMTKIFGEDHTATITYKEGLVFAFGEAGRFTEAIEMAQSLVAARTLLVGSQHEDTLRARNSLARWKFQSGAVQEAIDQLHALIPDQREHLGDDHPEIFKSISLLALALIEVRQFEHAQVLLFDLLPRQEEILGKNHEDVFTSRKRLAGLHGELGNLVEAIRAHKEVIKDLFEVYSPKDSYTFDVRHNLGFWLMEAGQRDEAREITEALVLDMLDTLGPNHSDVLTTRRQLASLMNKDDSNFRIMFERLLQERTQLLGEEHVETLSSRYDFIDAVAEQGDIEEALEMYEEFIPDLERILGLNHELTLRSKANYGYWLGRNEQYDKEVELLTQAKDGFTEIFGATNDTTLNVRRLLAIAVYHAEDGLEAAPHYAELIEDLEKVKGTVHVETINARKNYYQCLIWDEYLPTQIGSLCELEIALNDALELFGPDHELTMELAGELSEYQNVTGFGVDNDSVYAWRDNLNQLLARYPSTHPAVMRTREAFVSALHYMKSKEAIEQLQILISDQIDVFGESSDEVAKSQSMLTALQNDLEK